MGKAAFRTKGTSSSVERAEEAVCLLMPEIPPGCSSFSPLSAAALHAGDTMESSARAGECEEAARAFLVSGSRR